MAEQTATEKKPTEKKPSTLHEVFSGYAAKAKKAGKDHEVDIAKNIAVEFTADFKHIKKGQKQTISRVAYDFYNANGVVKEDKDAQVEEESTED